MTGIPPLPLRCARGVGDALLIAAGGAAGGIVRWQIGMALDATGWPWGTLLVNVVGSAGAGLLAGILTDAIRTRWLRPLLVIGFLGGLTTFSAVSAETVLLARADPVSGVIVLGVNLGASLVAAVLGLDTAHRWVARRSATRRAAGLGLTSASQGEPSAGAPSRPPTWGGG